MLRCSSRRMLRWFCIKRSLIDTQPLAASAWTFQNRGTLISRISDQRFIRWKGQLETRVLILGFSTARQMSRFGCNEFFNGYVSLYIYIYIIYNLFSIVAFSVDMGYLVVSVRFTIILGTHIEWPDAFFLTQLFGSAFFYIKRQGVAPKEDFQENCSSWGTLEATSKGWSNRMAGEQRQWGCRRYGTVDLVMYHVS